MAGNVITTTCCVVGGGPAGLMLGFLLARAGVAVVVLEKHADFLRDFRGDTVHPSTLEMIYELGLLDEFLRLPHQKLETLSVQIGERDFPVADFRSLPVHAKFIAAMPQWDFLNFIAAHGKRYSTFTLLQRTEAIGVIEENGGVVGVQAKAVDGELAIRADLVVGADGRHSTVRPAVGVAIDALGAPMDVLWFRLTRRPSDSDETTGRFDAGRIFIRINRGEHWQCAFVIAKGSLDRLRQAGIESFRASVAALIPFARARVGEIAGWDDVKLLTVALERLPRWYRPGLLCIGDAAHTMSPIGGVGVNLAVQDAVAAANLLAEKLRARRVVPDDLAAVQRRREFPTRVIQRMQAVAQNRIVAPLLAGSGGGTMMPPLALRLLARFPALRQLPARIIGLGVRREHVRTREWTGGA
jgi:2-polyprenyl-6-methoxyphenol hydroxylase-like FAD-dependent oxidoreductase